MKETILFDVIPSSGFWIDKVYSNEIQPETKNKYLLDSIVKAVTFNKLFQGQYKENSLYVILKYKFNTDQIEEEHLCKNFAGVYYKLKLGEKSVEYMGFFFYYGSFFNSLKL